MPNFGRKYKKLFLKDKKFVNEAIRAVADDPTLGQEKHGDLAGVFVYKFKITHREFLLAYEFSDAELLLLELGSHENFYRDLKRKR